MGISRVSDNVRDKVGGRIRGRVINNIRFMTLLPPTIGKLPTERDRCMVLINGNIVVIDNGRMAISTCIAVMA